MSKVLQCMSSLVNHHLVN